jgi:hypothetical protein
MAITGYCGFCNAWTFNRLGLQWHCAAEQWACDRCYARLDGLALWFWS